MWPLSNKSVSGPQQATRAGPECPAERGPWAPLALAGSAGLRPNESSPAQDISRCRQRRTKELPWSCPAQRQATLSKLGPEIHMSLHRHVLAERGKHGVGVWDLLIAECA